MKPFRPFIFSSDSSYRIDKLLLFNKNKSKCYTTINRKRESKDSTSDSIYELFGIFIHDVWYFYIGSLLVLPRYYYQYDSYEQMSFEELSYLARTMRHHFFLIDERNGKYKVDHDKVENYITPINLLGFWPGEPREGDEAWLTVYNRLMNDTISMVEIKKVNTAMEKAASEFVWKPTPKPKKTPIFETKAWKNRHN